MKLTDEQKSQIADIIDQTSLGCLIDAIVDQCKVLAGEAENERDSEREIEWDLAAGVLNDVSESLATLTLK